MICGVCISMSAISRSPWSFLMIFAASLSQRVLSDVDAQRREIRLGKRPVAGVPDGQAIFVGLSSSAFHGIGGRSFNGASTRFYGNPSTGLPFLPSIDEHGFPAGWSFVEEDFPVLMHGPDSWVPFLPVHPSGRELPALHFSGRCRSGLSIAAHSAEFYRLPPSLVPAGLSQGLVDSGAGISFSSWVDGTPVGSWVLCFCPRPFILFDCGFHGHALFFLCFLYLLLKLLRIAGGLDQCISTLQLLEQVMSTVCHLLIVFFSDSEYFSACSLHHAAVCHLLELIYFSAPGRHADQQ